MRMEPSLKRRVDDLPAVSFLRRFTAAGPSVLAAAVAFNLFFALVPGLASGLAAASFFGRDQAAIQQTEDFLDAVAPGEVATFVSNTVLPDVAAAVEENQGLFILISTLVSLWLASRGVVTLQRVLARIEGMDEDRSWIRVRIVGMLLTVGALLALLLSGLLLVASNAIADTLRGATDISWIVTAWEALALPLGSVGLFLFLVGLYRFGPPRRLPGLWLASTLATIGAVAASLGFRLFLDQAGTVGSSTLAVFTGFGVLLLWLYLIAWVIMIAAALAATVSRRMRQSVDGEEPGTEDIHLGLETLEQQVVGDQQAVGDAAATP